MKVLKLKGERDVNIREFREIFHAFREMNKESEQREFELQIPDMGLAEGEATAIKIVATNEVSGEIKGGINLIITG